MSTRKKEVGLLLQEGGLGGVICNCEESLRKRPSLGLLKQECSGQEERPGEPEDCGGAQM